jgi:hypothetical protein
VTVAVALLGVVVALLAVLVVSLLRSHAEILRALHDLGADLDPDHAAEARAARAAREAEGVAPGPAGAAPVDPAAPFTTVPGVPAPAAALGTRAHDLSGTEPSGDAVAVGVVGVRHRTLLAFLTSGCTTCRAFWTSFATGVDLPAQDIRLVVVTKGTEAESPAAIAELAPGEVPVVMSTDAWEDYGVPVAPYFVLVDGDEVVGEGAAGTWAQVVDLLGRSLADQGRSMSGGSSRRAFLTGRERAARIDAELTAAGFAPGDPRLHHEPTDLDGEAGR